VRSRLDPYAPKVDPRLSKPDAYSRAFFWWYIDCRYIIFCSSDASLFFELFRQEPNIHSQILHPAPMFLRRNSKSSLAFHFTIAIATHIASTARGRVQEERVQKGVIQIKISRRDRFVAHLFRRNLVVLAKLVLQTHSIVRYPVSRVCGCLFFCPEAFTHFLEFFFFAAGYPSHQLIGSGAIASSACAPRPFGFSG